MADSTELQISEAFASVYTALDMKVQRRALRSASRREAENVKKTAMALVKTTSRGKLSRSLSQATAGIENGILTRVFPDRYGAGFMATVIPHKGKGTHINRQGLEKPVLMWAETGTRSRHRGAKKGSVKTYSRLVGRATRKYNRSGAPTGRMPEYGFMQKAEEQAAQGVEKRLFDSFQTNIEKAARKQGLL